MATFSRESEPVRNLLLNMRCSKDEKELIAAIAPLLDVDGQSAVLRLALDYFFEHSPSAKAVLRRLKGK